jgi:hypothetical protein
MPGPPAGVAAAAAAAAAGGTSAQVAAPSVFLCPIAGTLMLDPVLASDGVNYERSAIEVRARPHAAHAAPLPSCGCSAPLRLLPPPLRPAFAHAGCARSRDQSRSDGCCPKRSARPRACR